MRIETLCFAKFIEGQKACEIVVAFRHLESSCTTAVFYFEKPQSMHINLRKQIFT